MRARISVRLWLLRSGRLHMQLWLPGRRLQRSGAFSWRAANLLAAGHWRGWRAGVQRGRLWGGGGAAWCCPTAPQPRQRKNLPVVIVLPWKYNAPTALLTVARRIGSIEQCSFLLARCARLPVLVCVVFCYCDRKVLQRKLNYRVRMLNDDQRGDEPEEGTHTQRGTVSRSMRGQGRASVDGAARCTVVSVRRRCKRTT